MLVGQPNTDPCDSQKAFRTRKEDQLRALEIQIANLKAKLESSNSENAELKAALSDAKTQIETLRSAIPNIARLTAARRRQIVDVIHDQQSHTLTLNLDLGKLLQSAGTWKQRQSSVSTPGSCHSSDSGIYLL